MRHPLKRLLCLAAFLFVVAALTSPRRAVADQVTLDPIKDNTLFETTDGSLSNGVGNFLFAGKTDQTTNSVRRAVMAFDVAGSVPAGSTIQNATLTLSMTRTVVGAMTFDLRRLTADWGEGASNATGKEGKGDAAEPGDATWRHTFYPDSMWTNPGGDYDDVTVSASASVGDLGFYTWGSTTQMVADIQGWLDAPATNFGWILIGPEGERSAKQFNSRENSDGPSLVINFDSAGPRTFNWIGTGAGGSFHEPTNWDANEAPSASTDIVNLVNNEMTDQVATLSSGIAVDDMTIDGDTNSMLLDIGQLTANVGDLEFGPRGGLAVEVVSGASGQLNASGVATLSGALALSVPGALPGPTETFELVTYASRIGVFDTISGEEIEPDRGFSLHYNDSRALAVAGQWSASGEELTGDVDVPKELLVSGAWDWNGLLIKRGAGELTLDLDGGFSAGGAAALAILEGEVRLQGTSQTISLGALTFGDLGQLSGAAALAGQYGWYGPVAIPEPCGLTLIALAALGLVSRRR